MLIFLFFVFSKITFLSGLSTANISPASIAAFLPLFTPTVAQWFAYIHPKFKTPTHGILFLGVLAFVAPLLGRPALQWIVNAGGIGVVLGYLLVAISFLKLRKTQPELERPYRIKNGKAVGIIAIVLSVLFLIIYLPGMPSSLAWPSEWLIVLVWYFIAFVLYFTQKRNVVSSEQVPIQEDR